MWPSLAGLLALALAVRLLTAALVRQPGYTDAYYYAVGARQLAADHGFTEPFIWNWLTPPDSVSHPGYQYWMPLAAILGWLGLATLGNSFWALQAPFVLLSALLPWAAYGVALDLGGKRKHALLAGLLAVFPGFYSYVFVLPDNFAPFALAGSLCLWTAGRGLRTRRAGWFALAGLAAGFGHLSRADGLLLLAVTFLVSILPSAGKSSLRARFLSPAACLIGYLLVMAPWFARNWLVAGSPLPAGGLQALFLTTYDDMFAYGETLTLDRYLAWGWDNILRSKLLAIGQNALRLWVESFAIVLLPLSGIGLWQLRRDPLLWPFLIYFPLLFLAMTLAFTFPGTRGGLFHSGGALLPFIFATAGHGLTVSVRWAARRLPRWHAQRAWQVFAGSLVATTILITAFALWRAGAFDGAWNRRDAHYAAAAVWLAEQGEIDPVIMVGDAPGFTWHTHLRAVAVPNEPLDTAVAAAIRYGATYLLLDDTRPRTTDALYQGELNNPQFELVYESHGARLYKIHVLPQDG